MKKNYWFECVKLFVARMQRKRNTGVKFLKLNFFRSIQSLLFIILFLRVNYCLSAERIVSLSPHLTEMVYAIGAGDRLVGRDASSDYPKQVKALPVVSQYNGVDVERLLALKPDLVLVWGAMKSGDLASVLQARHIKLYVDSPKSLSDIAKSMQSLAQLIGNVPKAQAEIDKFKLQLQHIARKYQKNQPSVFYQLGKDPIYTLGQGSVINDAISICGGKNIFADVKRPAFVVNKEDVLKRNPDLIISSEPDLSWQRWPLTAVQQSHVYVLNSSELARPTPRILRGVKKLCAIIAKVRPAP